jgi:hypothetical protein
MASELRAVAEPQDVTSSESGHAGNQRNECEELHFTPLFNNAQVSAGTRGGGSSGLRRISLHQRSDNEPGRYRTLIESTFTVWPSMDPDIVAMGFFASGLPFRAVDALALPDASSL